MLLVGLCKVLGYVPSDQVPCVHTPFCASKGVQAVLYAFACIRHVNISQACKHAAAATPDLSCPWACSSTQRDSQLCHPIRHPVRPELQLHVWLRHHQGYLLHQLCPGVRHGWREMFFVTSTCFRISVFLCTAFLLVWHVSGHCSAYAKTYLKCASAAGCLRGRWNGPSRLLHSWSSCSKSCVWWQAQIVRVLCVCCGISSSCLHAVVQSVFSCPALGMLLHAAQFVYPFAYCEDEVWHCMFAMMPVHELSGLPLSSFKALNLGLRVWPCEEKVEKRKNFA